MTAKKIRVLIVDDSAVVRKLASDALAADPEIEVVGTAIDPYMARDKLRELSPDVLTLDLEMPRMDGLTFLRLLMERRPMPVIVMSSLTQRGSEYALEALRLGAVDVLGKPSGSFSFGHLGPQLIAKVKTAAQARVRQLAPAAPAPTPAARHAAPAANPLRPAPAKSVADPESLRRLDPRSIILLGASTGGTEALRDVLTHLPANLPGIAIVQHIPATFSKAFADRLNTLCALEVREAADGDRITPGTALIAPGNFHMLLQWAGGAYRVRITDGPPVWHQRPAVDLLFKSAVECGAGPHALAGVLTGMGKDGAEGLMKLRDAGATTFAQDEASCVVYGMPKAAWDCGGAQVQISLDRIAPYLVGRSEVSPPPPPPPRPRAQRLNVMTAPVRSSPSILIVDDEPIVLGALKETLEREKFSVVACSSPIKALAVLEERDFAVIISDQKMPEMMGLEFLVESRRLRPHASRVLITAVLSLPTIVDAINKGEIFRFVAKPWLREELLATVRNAIQRHDLVTHNEVLMAQAQQLNAQLMMANSQLEKQVAALEQKRQSLDAANSELTARYESSLELCRRILTAYDPTLGGQAKALTEFAAKMADNGPFTDAEKHALKSAAWLCDLGLIGVSRELLRSFRSNPSQLTDRERATLHNHPIYSQTLAALVDPRPEVGEVIRAHHENFDGSGFPDGTSAKLIPWAARCLAVAVGFVESTAPKQATIDAILARSGTKYDPEAVRLFLKVTQLVHLPRQVREVLLDELEPGMVLATGIYSPHGLLLIGEGQALGPATIAKIRDHNNIAPISQRLLVYG